MIDIRRLGLNLLPPFFLLVLILQLLVVLILAILRIQKFVHVGLQAFIELLIRDLLIDAL
jgi:hypothetical protein